MPSPLFRLAVGIYTSRRFAKAYGRYPRALAKYTAYHACSTRDAWLICIIICRFKSIHILTKHTTETSFTGSASSWSVSDMPCCVKMIYSTGYWRRDFTCIITAALEPLRLPRRCLLPTLLLVYDYRAALSPREYSSNLRLFTKPHETNTRFNVNEGIVLFGCDIWY